MRLVRSRYRPSRRRTVRNFWRLRRSMNMELSLSISISTRRHAVGARAGRTKLHQHLLARYFHGGKLAQPLPQPLHLPLAHRAFLADAIDAFGIDVKFAV